MTIHPMASRADRIRALQRTRDLPLRRETLIQLGLMPPEPVEPPIIAGWRRPPRDAANLRWPLIGAALDLQGPPIPWENRRLRDLIQPVSSVQIGILSSQGLMPLARDYRLSLHKISVIARENDDFQRRITSLEHDRYAGLRMDASGAFIADHGFNQWQLNTLPALPERSPWNPVRARHRYLEARLPWNVTLKDFDNALTEGFESARVDLWVETAHGQAHCRRLGRDPNGLKRFTSYDLGGTRPHVREAREIVNIQPQRQAGLLMLVIEETILKLSGWNGLRRWW